MHRIEQQGVAQAGPLESVAPAPTAPSSAISNQFTLEVNAVCLRWMPVPMLLTCAVTTYAAVHPLYCVIATACFVAFNFALNAALRWGLRRGRRAVDWTIGPGTAAVCVFVAVLSSLAGPQSSAWITALPALCVLGFLAPRWIWLVNASIVLAAVAASWWVGQSLTQCLVVFASLASIALLTSPLITRFRAIWDRALSAGEALEIANLQLRERQELLEVLLGEAKQAVVAKDRFLANMSHEMRTPLNGILGVVSLLRSSELPDEQKELVEIARQSANDLLAQVSDVLDLTRLESARLHIESEPFDLLGELQRLANEFRCVPACADRDFQLEASGPIPRWVMGDRTRVRQVVRNLLANAFKFTDARGRVRLQLRAEATDDPARVRVRICVSDDGIGIALEAQARIFERFEQVDSSTTRKYGGAGLGLAISRQLVQAMGGTMGLQSAPGTGSSFWFELELPCASHDLIDPGATGPEPVPAAHTAGRNVLLVEDLRINQIIVSRMLEKLGCRVTLAGNGLEALEQLSEERFDAVLMDCQMPELDGFQATRQLRALEAELGRPHTPVLALTAGVAPGDPERCLAAGMDAFLGKPLREGDLERALADLLSGPLPRRPPPAAGVDSPRGAPEA